MLLAFLYLLCGTYTILDRFWTHETIRSKVKAIFNFTIWHGQFSEVITFIAFCSSYLVLQTNLLQAEWLILTISLCSRFMGQESRKSLADQFVSISCDISVVCWAGGSAAGRSLPHSHVYGSTLSPPSQQGISFSWACPHSLVFSQSGGLREVWLLIWWPRVPITEVPRAQKWKLPVI